MLFASLNKVCKFIVLFIQYVNDLDVLTLCKCYVRPYNHGIWRLIGILSKSTRDQNPPDQNPPAFKIHPI